MRTQIKLLGLCLAFAAAPSLAGEMKLMPVLDADFKPDFTVSALVGAMNPERVGSDTFAGAEVAFNCIVMQPSTGRIRTKISYGEFSNGGLELSSFEVNPRWMFDIDKNLSVGFGPGLGYVDAKSAGRSKGMWAGQLGADLDYRMGAVTLGLSTRWQGTDNRTIAPGQKGADNILVAAKIGYNF